MKYLIVGLGTTSDLEYECIRHNAGFMIRRTRRQSCGSHIQPNDTATSHMHASKRPVSATQTSPVRPQAKCRDTGKKKKTSTSTTSSCSSTTAPYPSSHTPERRSGNDAGHNGLKNIAQMLGTQAYPRPLRHRQRLPAWRQIDYVLLGQFTEQECEGLTQRIPVAVDAIKTFCLAGMQRAMCDYNNK